MSFQPITTRRKPGFYGLDWLKQTKSIKTSYMNKVLFILLIFFMSSTIVKAQDLSYDDLISELQYKRAKASKYLDGESLTQKSISLGMVTTLAEVASIDGAKHPMMQGFEMGLNSDLGSRDVEARTLFRYFFENQNNQERASLRELAFQVTKKENYYAQWDWFYGGGFSLRHLLYNNSLNSINETTIQLNAITGLETKLSSSSRLMFELGSRFPFGVAGRDRFSLDTAIKLKTEIE